MEESQLCAVSQSQIRGLAMAGQRKRLCLEVDVSQPEKRKVVR
jgi:hypothetical protein